MGQIKWTEKALAHLQSIHRYISEDSPTYANNFAKALVKAILKLEQFPYYGRKVPEFEGLNFDFREVIHQNYRIIYRIIEPKKDIEILLVIHSSRDFFSAIKREWEL